MDQNVRNIYLLYLGLRVDLGIFVEDEVMDGEGLWYKSNIIELKGIFKFIKNAK